MFKFWERLVGQSENLSNENKTVNSVLIISLCLLLMSVPVNIYGGLITSNIITAVMATICAILYYLSRYRQLYQVSIVIFALVSYGGLIFNYIYNSGINGPTIFLFFLSFLLLIAITSKKQHMLWVILHIATVAILLITEYNQPDQSWNSYTDNANRFFDVAATYIFSLVFVYIITNYLLNKYNKEKQLAKERADAIEEQNRKLKDIAWLQSHKIRSHVATILGLAEIIENYPDEAENKNIIKDIKSVAHKLDDAIRDINLLTQDSNKG